MAFSTSSPPMDERQKCAACLGKRSPISCASLHSRAPSSGSSLARSIWSICSMAAVASFTEPICLTTCEADTSGVSIRRSFKQRGALEWRVSYLLFTRLMVAVKMRLISAASDTRWQRAMFLRWSSSTSLPSDGPGRSQRPEVRGKLEVSQRSDVGQTSEVRSQV